MYNRRSKGIKNENRVVTGAIRAIANTFKPPFKCKLLAMDLQQPKHQISFRQDNERSADFCISRT